MTHLERFKAVVHFERPDYVPIFGLKGAGFAHGAFTATHRRLVETGMPSTVGGIFEIGKPMKDSESWQRYWGTTTPIFLELFPADPPRGIETETRIEGEYEIVTSESGAVTRQMIDNPGMYGMPEFLVYDVRDRQSWEFYRDRMTPGPLWPDEKIEAECRIYKGRDRPLALAVGGTWGSMRNLMGPEMACTVLYDDPGLARDIIEWFLWNWKTYFFPLIERLRPEIVWTNEDICYKSGMLISPAHFMELCGDAYRDLTALTRNCGIDLVFTDTDGKAMEYVPLLHELGVNGCFPFEVKAGNDLFELRRRFPRFIFMGWLEKEVMNAGNQGLIEREILSKVPALLPSGGYFPTVDHSIQPLITFENMCRFMTLLHEVTGNPEGEFPHIPAVPED
ncbi:MAG TPA: hypothetical protein VMX75_11020 [Spirochaetia bacterium]|nr:hypothetical protein [Spirochaetia bacterium]